MSAEKISILISREQSSMASSWDEHLGLCRVDDKTWRIGIYGNDWLGSIHELIPEDERYTEDGHLKIPSELNGVRIVGLADGEYLQTEDLVPSLELEFSVKEIRKALEFCRSEDWTKHPDFPRAWEHIEMRVISTEPSNDRNGQNEYPIDN